MSDLTDSEVAELRTLLGKVRADKWTGATLNAQLPRMVQRASLPTASADLAYRMVTIPGTPDVTYQCLRDAGGTWGWKTVATG